ncbi:MAG: molybdenum cofactor biosynthesis protein MoaE [Gammaproteobacteria bacterium]
MKIEIRARAFAPWEEIAAYQARLPAGGYGACAAFVGTMRDFHAGARVTNMTLEHYAGMTERQLQRLTDDAMRRHRLLDALVVHRVGALLPNEPIVLVAAWSAHRAEAFAACAEIMEMLKSRATFWKKETRTDGDRWVEKNTPG